jgi:hypothetical protein
MFELPRQQLRDLITSHGTSLCEEPGRCEALLREACPGYAPAVEVLLIALNQKVPADLAAAPAGTRWDALAPPLVRRLKEEVTAEAARWAVESWGLALGKVTDAQLPASPAPAEDGPAEEDAGQATASRPVLWLVYLLLLGFSWAILGLNGWGLGGLIGRLSRGGRDWNPGGSVGLAVTGTLVLLLIRSLRGMHGMAALGAVSGAVILGTVGLGWVDSVGLGLGFVVGGFFGAWAGVVISLGRQYSGALLDMGAGVVGCGLAGALGEALTGVAGWTLAGAAGLAVVQTVGCTASAYACREERGLAWVVQRGLLAAVQGVLGGALAGALASLLARALVAHAWGIQQLPQFIVDAAGRDKVLGLVLTMALAEAALLLVCAVGLVLQGRTRPKAKGGKVLEGHTAPVRCVAVSPDGKWAASGSEDETLRLWDLQAGEEVRRFKGHRGHVTAVAVTRDGRRLLSGATDHTLRLWDVASGKELRRLRLPGSGAVNVLAALSGDGRLAVTGSDGQGGWSRKSWLVYLWDLESGELLHRFKGHGNFLRRGLIASVALTPDGRSALSGSQDRTLRLWDVASGTEVRCFTGHTGAVTAVAFSPDGRRILSGSLDKTVRLWDAAGGEEVACFRGHTDVVWSVAFSPDGGRVLSGGQDGTIRLWDVQTGVELHRFEGQEAAAGIGGVHAVAFVPDGRGFLSGSADHTVRLWDIPRS